MYIPLFNKTTYSFLSSLIEIDDLIEIAKNNNLTSIAISDTNMYGVMEFIIKCKDNNIKPIIGVYFKDRLLYAKNYQGYLNLLKLINIQSEKELTNDDYNLYKDNLICIALNGIETNYDDMFYPLTEDNNDKENVVYINELLYKEPSDYEILKYLELLRDNKTIASEYEEKKNCYYKEVNVIKKALDNTFKIANMCNLELPNYELNLALFDKDVDPKSYLTNLSLKGLSKRLNGNIASNYKIRLKHELDIINNMGFANYFLVVYDFIKYAKSKKILVGPGRGSAAGSLVAYTLGITDIDPLKYDLIFERFLNPERVTMPDIDTDFPDKYRDDIINYVKEKYGKKHVSNIITFNSMGAKLSIRDIGRVMNVSLLDIDKITKIIGNRKESLKEISKDIRIQKLIKEDFKIKKLIEVAERLEGIKRNTSVHAAGIIISNDNLDSLVPLIYDNTSDSYISGYEAVYLEKLGLLKMDFLGIKNLTTIMEIIEDVYYHENVQIDFNNIELDDNETFKLFQEGDTNGIFQFESTGMKNFLKELKPRNFIELSDAIALFRPGPASSIPSYIRRKNHEEEIDYFIPELKEVLKSTEGIIIYQEQIMKIACIIAGYTLGEADILRRAMSKKKLEIMENEREKFISSSVKRGYSIEIATKIYNLIEKFASYGFNKSHSIAYTIVAYKMAYLKVHYKKYFYVSLLNSVISDTNKTSDYLYEMKKYNLNVKKPDIRFSTNKYIIKDNEIIAPFNIIKGISNIISSKIMNERSDYNNIYDIFANLSLSDKYFEMLIKSGCFDNFYNRKTLIENLNSLMRYKTLYDDLDEFSSKPEIIQFEEYSSIELIEMEKELYGFYLSNHPVLEYKVKDQNIIDLKDIEKYFNKKIEVMVLVESIHEITTKKGDKMLFFKGSDEERVADFTLFPEEYEKYFNIRKNYVLKVYGKVEKRNGNFQIIVSKIENMEV